jgi:hypothetical protein
VDETRSDGRTWRTGGAPIGVPADPARQALSGADPGAASRHVPGRPLREARGVGGPRPVVRAVRDAR